MLLSKKQRDVLFYELKEIRPFTQWGIDAVSIYFLSVTENSHLERTRLTDVNAVDILRTSIYEHKQVIERAQQTLELLTDKGEET